MNCRGLRLPRSCLSGRAESQSTPVSSDWESAPGDWANCGEACRRQQSPFAKRRNSLPEAPRPHWPSGRKRDRTTLCSCPSLEGPQRLSGRSQGRNKARNSDRWHSGKAPPTVAEREKNIIRFPRWLLPFPSPFRSPLPALSRFLFSRSFFFLFFSCFTCSNDRQRTAFSSRENRLFFAPHFAQATSPLVP